MFVTYTMCQNSCVAWCLLHNMHQNTKCSRCFSMLITYVPKPQNVVFFNAFFFYVCRNCIFAVFFNACYMCAKTAYLQCYMICAKTTKFCVSWCLLHGIHVPKPQNCHGHCLVYIFCNWREKKFLVWPFHRILWPWYWVNGVWKTSTKYLGEKILKFLL